MLFLQWQVEAPSVTILDQSWHTDQYNISDDSWTFKFPSVKFEHSLCIIHYAMHSTCNVNKTEKTRLQKYPSGPLGEHWTVMTWTEEFIHSPLLPSSDKAAWNKQEKKWFAVQVFPMGQTEVIHILPYLSLRPTVQRKTPPKATSSPKMTEKKHTTNSVNDWWS